MFTTPCFIKTNTPQLRKRLEELGYIPPYKIWSDENFAICTIYRDNIGEYIVFKIDDDFENVIKPSYPYIDCGTNEELFLALAALRDDTDKKQWFIMDYGFQKTWVFSETKQFDTNQPFAIKAYKATVEEIMEHFK